MTIAVLLVATSLAGPWTRDQGEYYAHLGADAYVPRVYVDPLSGQPIETDRRYFGVQYGLYGEVGVSKGRRVQLTASVPLSVASLTFEAPGGMGKATTVRLGDARVAGQIELVEGKPLAAAVEVKVPLYANDSVGAGHGVYQANFPKPGDGQVDTTVWLLGGAAREALWGEAALGWTHRTELFVGWRTGPRLTDGVDAALTGGARLGPALAMIKANGRFNPVNDGRTREWLTVGPTVLIDVGPVAIELRAAYDVWAAHAARGIGWGLAVSSRKPK